MVANNAQYWTEQKRFYTRQEAVGIEMLTKAKLWNQMQRVNDCCNRSKSAKTMHQPLSELLQIKRLYANANYHNIFT